MPRKSKKAMICTNASAASVKKRRQSLASTSLDTSALLDASLDTSASLDMDTSLDTSLDSSVFLEPVQENTDPTYLAPCPSSASTPSSMLPLHESTAGDDISDSSGSEDDSEHEDDSTKEEKLQDFSYEWLVEMDKDFPRSLGVFLCNVFTSNIGMK